MPDSINQQKLEHLVATILGTIRHYYPGWTSFRDPDFIKDERDHKQQAIDQAQDLLSASDLTPLVQEENWDAIRDRIIKACSSNLLYHAVPARSDYCVILESESKKREFVLAFIEMLHGEGAPEDRLEAFADFVAKNGWTNRWTFITYFLYLFNPGECMFVKPRAIGRLLAHIGLPNIQSRPNRQHYQGLQDLSSKLLEALRPYGATDMSDVITSVFMTFGKSEPVIGSPAPTTDPFTINISTEDYISALQETSMPDSMQKALTVLVNDFGGTAMANDLATALGYSHVGPLNSLTGKFGRALADHPAIDFHGGDDGGPGWWEVIFTGRSTSNGFEWSIRPAFQMALENLGLISASPPEVSEPDPEWIENAAFTPEAFSLLEQLHAESKARIYNQNQDRFQEALIDPFRSLVKEVADSMPDEIRSHLETEKRIFSRILKNDYGRGGAWDFYWSAFFPKGGKRTEDAQLFTVITHEHVRFGFAIGQYAGETMSRLSRLLRANSAPIANLINESNEEVGPWYLRDESEAYHEVTALEWCRQGGGPRGFLCRIWSRDQVLYTPRADLLQSISDTLQAVFPLLLLAHSDDPDTELSAILNEPEDDHPDLQPEYSLKDCSAALSMDVSMLNRWIASIGRKGQAVIYGPPGTGKTYAVEHLARHLVGGKDGFVDLVQFHPSYGYEDFMQGLRPISRDDGRLDYRMVPGKFHDFCREARTRSGPCVLIVDEINRANLSKVFGELMYLLEYRGQKVTLAGGGSFSIPPNVILLGTMNTADRSIALVDHALRRRFAFLELTPNMATLLNFHDNSSVSLALVDLLKEINAEIGDRHYQIGISYFLVDQLIDHLEMIWCTEITPYLEELFFDREDRARKYSWESVKAQLLG